MHLPYIKLLWIEKYSGLSMAFPIPEKWKYQSFSLSFSYFLWAIFFSQSLCLSTRKPGFPRAASTFWRAYLHWHQSSGQFYSRQISLLEKFWLTDWSSLINQEGFCGKCHQTPCHPLSVGEKPCPGWRHPAIRTTCEDAEVRRVIGFIISSHTKAPPSSFQICRLHQYHVTHITKALSQKKPSTPGCVTQNTMQTSHAITYELIEVAVDWLICSQPWRTCVNRWS